ncbi:MAG: branched-chain amino acid ABC transporter substrate-binding protein [Acidobacteria bacterium RIFCSPLOWO2_02_FULL_68_18]|nr:MAG: branched-chain amino acid ABC transporter substrate-binding protein [Acidobacteria bacterium RIFCSPLOWO2_02_FULL_68_18]OFW49765.1 MAG: branched-chain amino acid ABC transporter substrate-binding protein [Acidobacteria bacterium RIFCSPLOWO2_12_FULL_68_19]
MVRPLGALLALALAAEGCAPAPADTKAVRVGIILTYSGPDASIGEAIDRGAELYRRLHARELPPGVELQLVKRDETGPSPDVAKRLARELVVREQVQILTGGQWTPNVSAIAPLATEASVPYVVMSSGTASTTRLSPFLFRVAFTTWQHSYPLGQWAARNGLRRVSTVVSDYAAGADAEEAFVRGFTDAGGTIVSKVRAPLRTADFVPFLERVRRDRPQAVYGFNPGGPEATRFIKAYHDLGLAASGIALIGPNAIVPDDELANMGEAAIGVISASHYSAAGDRPANETFVGEWKKAYGAESVPNYFAVGGWDGMAAIFHLIREQNGEIDPARSRQLLASWSNPDSPRGPMRIDPDSRDVIHNIYIRRVEKVGGELRNVEFATLPAVKDPWKELHPDAP